MFSAGVEPAEPTLVHTTGKVSGLYAETLPKSRLAGVQLIRGPPLSLPPELEPPVA